MPQAGLKQALFVSSIQPKVPTRLISLQITSSSEVWKRAVWFQLYLSAINSTGAYLHYYSPTTLLKNDKDLITLWVSIGEANLLVMTGGIDLCILNQAESFVLQVLPSTQ